MRNSTRPVLLKVSSGTTVPIFSEIGAYLTDKEQKMSWHSFFLRHGVYKVTANNSHKRADEAYALPKRNVLTPQLAIEECWD